MIKILKEGAVYRDGPVFKLECTECGCIFVDTNIKNVALDGIFSELIYLKKCPFCYNGSHYAFKIEKIEDWEELNNEPVNA